MGWNESEGEDSHVQDKKNPESLWSEKIHPGSFDDANLGRGVP